MPLETDEDAEREAGEIGQPGSLAEAREAASDTLPPPFDSLPDAEVGGPQARSSYDEAEETQDRFVALALVGAFLAPWYWRPASMGREDFGHYVDSRGRVLSGSALYEVLNLSLRNARNQHRTVAQAIQLDRLSARERLIEIARAQAGMRNAIGQIAGRTAFPVELPRGALPMDVFQEYMARRIRSLHLLNASLARGGFLQLDEATLEAIRRGSGAVTPGAYRGVDFHMQRFARMMRQVEDGTQRLDGTFIRRAEMYANSGRQTFDFIKRQVRLEEGFREVRNRLTAAEHCGECPDLSARGWVPVREMPLIGNRECLTNCKCYLQFRNVETGRVVR